MDKGDRGWHRDVIALVPGLPRSMRILVMHRRQNSNFVFICYDHRSAIHNLLRPIHNALCPIHCMWSGIMYNRCSVLSPLLHTRVSSNTDVEEWILMHCCVLRHVSTAKTSIHYWT